MSKKLFTKVVSLSLTAAMVLSMAPVNASAAKTAKPKSMKVSKASKIKVGQTKTITASRKNKKSNKDVKYVNFKPANTKNIGIGVKTDNADVVSVEKINNAKYSYTGVSAGEATLTITSRAKTAKGKKLQAKLAVTVINAFQATQKGAYTFEFSTGEKLEKVDKKQVKVMEKDATVETAVKSVELSEDKMTVKVTMVIPFTDKKTYDITFTNNDKELKDSFEASVGEPKTISIEPQTAAKLEPTELKFMLLDEKNMDVSEIYPDKTKNQRLEVKVTGKAAYNQAEKKITMWNVGDTAEVEAIYHDGKFDAQGKEGVISQKATITCTEKGAVSITGVNKYIVADKILSWETDEEVHSIPAEMNKKLFVSLKKSDKKTVDNAKDNKNFTFESVNKDILHVSDNTVYGLKEGVAYVKVTYTEGTTKYEYTLPITITAARKATTLILDKQYVSMATTTDLPEVVEVTILDQYGKKMKDAKLTSVVAEKLSGDDVATIAQDGTTAVKVTKTAKGSGMYKIKVMVDSKVELTTTMTVDVSDVSSVASDYELVASATEFDATIRENSSAEELTEATKGIEFKLYETKAGRRIADATAKLVAATVKINGKDVKPVATKTLATSLVQVATGEITLYPAITDGSNYASLLAKGVYNVEIESSDKKIKKNAVITITNDTAAAEKDKSYSIDKLNATAAMTAGAIVTAAIKDKTADTPIIAYDNNLAASAVVLGKNGGNFVEVEGANTVNGLEGGITIRRAALPSFRVLNKTALVWVLTDGLSLSVDKLDEALVIGAWTEPSAANMVYKAAGKIEAPITVTSFPKTLADDKMSVKIFKKGDTVDLANGAGAKFDLEGDNGITVSGTGFTLGFKQKAAGVDVGTYVAEVTFKDGDFTKTATKDFAITEAIIETTKFDVATSAPTGGQGVEQLGDPSVTPSDGLALSVKWYKGDAQYDTTTEIKGGETFENGKFATAVITLTVDKNYKLKDNFTVTLGNSAEQIKSDKYDIKKGASLNEWIISSKTVLS